MRVKCIHDTYINVVSLTRSKFLNNNIEDFTNNLAHETGLIRRVVFEEVRNVRESNAK